MGDHQLLLKGALHYRGLVRVPFIWCDPKVQPSSIVSTGICGTLDIAKTILARAGFRGYNGIQGMDLMPAVRGGPTGHDSMVIEEHQRRGYMGFANNFRARTLVTPSERLTLYEGADWGELYDLGNDPDELRNLWNDAAARGRRHELTEKLAREMMQLADASPLALHHGP
jgi:arylsulfatase A-like enzyme